VTVGDDAEWLTRDPIVLFRGRLIDEFGVDAAVVDLLDDEVRAEVDDAVEFAKASPFPEPEAAFDDLYATRSAVPVPLI
jgi:pyruvate dehydrogenase E1 component alpha subunit